MDFEITRDMVVVENDDPRGATWIGEKAEVTELMT